MTRAASSLQILTDGLFDYAGMFPPAALSFTDALRTSADLPKTLQRPGLLAADMVLTAKDVKRLDPATLSAHGFDRPCRLCVVGVRAQDAEEWAGRLAAMPDAIVPVSLEVVGTNPPRETGTLHAAMQALPEGARLFYEPRWKSATWKTGAGGIWPALASLQGAGLKVRCADDTGLDAEALSAVVTGAAARSIPLKATQGLHHAFAGDKRHGNEHGFLNLAVALRLTQALDLDEYDVEQILTDHDRSSFVIRDGIGWHEHRIRAAALEDAVASLPFSIGSCSLHEPDADLAALEA